ncbi:MAG: 1-(5-phosphoribosyl)-5-[Peptococcaceae bacterium]|nr:1-(5-phosphoribosyl)-5-[(5-phosphoribosylamino)methylideneamino] imidazole-4-carboxamide isomerase [Peptococcaceae bacterium]
TAEQVAASPYDTAASFKQAGAAWIHMVDLDGAKDAKPVNADIFCKVAAESGLKVELGGGIRNMDTIEYYLNKGIERVILGSVAVKNPALVKDAVNHFGGRIAVGIDAKNEMVATEGWLDTSNVHYIEMAKMMEAVGVQTIIYTDISKDGMLSGVNGEQLDAINRAVSCGIIASGGVKSIADIELCKQLNLYGVICGKSIYSGSLNLAEAVAKAGAQTC